MTVELTYFLGQQLMGTAHSSVGAPISYLAVCPTCGAAWGRLISSEAKRWLPIMRGCKLAHARDSLDRPGSLLIDHEFYKPYSAPRSVLMRELDLAEKGAGFAYPIVSWYSTYSQLLEPTMSPDLQSRIAELRTKALADELTDEELKEAMSLLRADRRFAAAKVGAAKRAERAASSAVPVDTDALLKSFF